MTEVTAAMSWPASLFLSDWGPWLCIDSDVCVCVCVIQFLFQQLGVIIAIVKHHIKNYLEDIFALIKVGNPSSHQ